MKWITRERAKQILEREFALYDALSAECRRRTAADE